MAPFGQLSGDVEAMGIKVRGSGKLQAGDVNMVLNSKRQDEFGEYRGEKMLKELSPGRLQCLKSM